MAFCKFCTCGEKIVFERPLSFPDNCPACGRKLVDIRTFNEDDPQVKELEKAATKSEEKTDLEALPSNEINRKRKFVLKLSNGKEIDIPDDGCIIGRTEVGAEELAEFPSVSRQHLRVIIRRNIGVIIEDISRYGTLVDGRRITKNLPVRVADGSKITLCNLEALLIVKEKTE